MNPGLCSPYWVLVCCLGAWSLAYVVLTECWYAVWEHEAWPMWSLLSVGMLSESMKPGLHSPYWVLVCCLGAWNLAYVVLTECWYAVREHEAWPMWSLLSVGMLSGSMNPGLRSPYWVLVCCLGAVRSLHEEQYEKAKSPDMLVRMDSWNSVNVKVALLWKAGSFHW